MRGELRGLLTLAIPVVLSELAWSAMNVIDLLIVGRVGVEAIGAVSLGSTLHFSVLALGLGLLMGMDTLVSQAFGAGDARDCRKTLRHGVWLALAASPLIMGLVWGLRPTLAWWGTRPEVLAEVGPYLDGLNWSTGPLMVYFAFRRYLQALGLVRPVLAVMVCANALNTLLTIWWVLGGLGLPGFGVAGAGWATCASRVFMTLALGWIIRARHAEEARAGESWLKSEGWRGWRDLDRARFARLLALGIPAGVHLGLEMWIFSVATFLAGRIGVADLAAHQIALSMAGLTFMMPLGVSAAGAVRVGHRIGAGEWAGARLSGWTALGVGVGFMGLAGLTFLAIPGVLVGAYTTDPEVVAVAVPLLFLAALFQVFDGAQVVTAGILRGAGETRAPMVCNLVAHWCVGLPVAWWLGIGSDWGVRGLWVGLTTGLVVASVGLIVVWTAQSNRFARNGSGVSERGGRDGVEKGDSELGSVRDRAELAVSER